MRRLQHRVAVAGEVAVALVVGHDHDDVGARGGLGGEGEGGDPLGGRRGVAVEDPAADDEGCEEHEEHRSPTETGGGATISHGPSPP